MRDGLQLTAELPQLLMNQLCTCNPCTRDSKQEELEFQTGLGYIENSLSENSNRKPSNTWDFTKA